LRNRRAVIRDEEIIGKLFPSAKVAPDLDVVQSAKENRLARAWLASWK
jgi:hypothetical protein